MQSQTYSQKTSLLVFFYFKNYKKSLGKCHFLKRKPVSGHNITTCFERTLEVPLYVSDSVTAGVTQSCQSRLTQEGHLAFKSDTAGEEIFLFYFEISM